MAITTSVNLGGRQHLLHQLPEDADIGDLLDMVLGPVEEGVVHVHLLHDELIEGPVGQDLTSGGRGCALEGDGGQTVVPPGVYVVEGGELLLYEGLSGGDLSGLEVAEVELVEEVREGPDTNLMWVACVGVVIAQPVDEVGEVVLVGVHRGVALEHEVSPSLGRHGEEVLGHVVGVDNHIDQVLGGVGVNPLPLDSELWISDEGLEEAGLGLVNTGSLIEDD